MNLFHSVNKKLWRAHQHVDALNRSIDTWQDAPHTFVIEKSPDSRTFVAGIAFETPAPIDEWALLLGDAVHNWRSALDHAVYAMAIHDTGHNPPPRARYLSFPITCTPEDFKKQRNSLRGLTPASRQAVESVQPYNRTDHYPGLLRLQDLDNQDKHRAIRVSAVAPRDALITFPDETVDGTGTLRLHALDTTKPDWIFAVHLDEPRPAGIEMNIETRIMVKLEDEPIPQPTLSELLSHFNSEVWTVKARLEEAIDTNHHIGPTLTIGLWPPAEEQWIGQTRKIQTGTPPTRPN